MWKLNKVLLLLLCANETHSFTIHSQLSYSATTTAASAKTILNQQVHGNDQLDEIGEQKPRQMIRKKSLRTFGHILMERSDTLRSAGFYDANKISNEEEQEYHEPLMAGAKTNLTLFALALGYKWYRSIFINKMAIWERQPQWNTVITSKEDEEKANLEALTCNNCGAIIFIAKGRKWFQVPRGYECYVCGASGNDNFTNTREDLLEEIDDDYFDYEKPLDFVTAAERKKLMKEAGGDEELATALLTQKNEEAEAEADASGEGGDEAPKKKKKKKGKKKKKKKIVEASNADSEEAPQNVEKSVEQKKESDDELDILGMD